MLEKVTSENNLQEQTTSDEASDLLVLQKEVQRKIGRNLLVYQQIEQLLKNFVTIARVGGAVTNFQKIFDKRRAKTHKSMLGMLAEEFFASCLLTSDSENRQLQDKEVPSMSLSHTIIVEAEFHQQQKHLMESLISERNNLVHNMILQLDPTSSASMINMDRLLDEQRERALQVLNPLQAFNANRINPERLALMTAGMEFLLSDNRLPQLLLEITNTGSNPEHWVWLDEAENLLQQAAPDDIAAIPQTFGFASLHELLAGCGLFELKETATPENAVRIAYRVKQEIKIDFG